MAQKFRAADRREYLSRRPDIGGGVYWKMYSITAIRGNISVEIYLNLSVLQKLHTNY